MKKIDQVCYLYLLLPFILFCLTWLKLPIGLVITTLLIWIVWRILRRSKAAEPLPGKLWVGILLLGLWVILSGVGGFAFQNQDHHVRNAVFRDLIENDWPVVFPLADGGSLKVIAYYIGYWLPAALVGKIGGWVSANIALFLWTWLGVILVALQVARKLNRSLLFAALLLIFFSGMDAIGTLFMRGIFPTRYPGLWPPIQHLEWWAPMMQFSSFTTQLFWVFNQAVPAWLCMALILNRQDNRQVGLIWSLCFFYAPLPALGMLPLVLAGFFPKQGEEWKGLWEGTKALFRNVMAAVNIENTLGAGLVAAVAYLYFSMNQTVARYGLFKPDQIAIPIYILFLLAEGFLLWALLLPKYKKDFQWYLIGMLLLISPWVSIGLSNDFCMRASIPALFCLMAAVGENLSLIKRDNRALGVILSVCLVIGALTPLYEINRSVYRTVQYYWQVIRYTLPPDESDGDIYSPYVPENDHPDSLVADHLISLSKLKPSATGNFLAEPGDSLFYRCLLKKTE